MDDTREILERLERIGALTGIGAERSNLLREVRGLLEEGERRLRVEHTKDPAREGPKAHAPGGTADGRSASSSNRVGEEATVA